MKSRASDSRAPRAARVLLAIAFACVLGTPVVAVAQPAAADVNAQERDRALKLGLDALAAYERGDFRTAFAGFEKASEILRAPTFLLFMARCQDRLGELLRARDLYRSLADLRLGPDAPEQFIAAQRDGQRELAELAGRIPALTIEVKGAPTEEVRVTLDGEVLDAAALDQPMQVDPGAHDLQATAPGFAPAKAHVELAQAANENVTLTLVPGSEQDEPGGGTSSGSLAPAAVAFAIGGAGIVLGAITGGLAMPKVDDIKSRCVDGHCPVEDEALADEARVLTTLSTVGFVVGGVGLATGIVLAIVQPGGDEPADEAAFAPSLRLSLSPFGQLSLGGSF